MKLVVDASAAYHFISETAGESVLREAELLVAPDILVAEMFNARWKMLRAGLHAATPQLILSFIERVRLLPSIDYAIEADQLARRIDHPVYDCLYAAAATRHAATLVTADARFANKISDVPMSVLSVS